MEIINGEIIKFLNNKRAIVYLILALIIGNYCFISLVKYNGIDSPVCEPYTIDEGDWRENVTKQIKNKENKINKYLKEGYTYNDAEIIKIHDSIRILEYYLDNNIEYSQRGTFRYAMDITQIVGNMLLVVSLVFIVSLFTREYANNTWKSIVLTGVSKWKIILYKLMSGIVLLVIIDVIYLVIVCLCGTIGCGYIPNERLVVIESGQIYEKSMAAEIISSMIRILYKQIIGTIMIGTIQTIFKMSIITNVFACLYGVGIFNFVFHILDLREYVPSNLFMSEDNGLFKTIIYPLLFIVAITILLIHVFSHMDINTTEKEYEEC